MILFNNRIAAVSAQMMTWEVTTVFDGTLTETELQKRFDDEFDVGEREIHASFWPLVSFNATDGRKHRYLVSVANEPLLPYRKKFDCSMPRQIALYAIADKILRGEKVEGAVAENLSEEDVDGNLMLVALWNNVLYILVFVQGRLCHWSEEFEYGECFDNRVSERVSRFKNFLKSDEFFSNAGVLGEFYVLCDDNVNMDNLFKSGVRDSFWKGLDLDKCIFMKPCQKRRLSLCALMLLICCLFLALVSNRSWMARNLWQTADDSSFEKVSAVELSLPAAHDLEMLAWAEGHRELLPAKWMFGRDARRTCESLDYKLQGIVGGRVALMQSATGETKTVMVGDSLSRYRVKKIGRNEVVLRCGRKEIRYEVGAPIVSQANMW